MSSTLFSKLPLLRRSLFAMAGAVVVLSSLASASHAMARPPHDMAAMSTEDMARMRQHMLDRATRELSLDEAQKQRLATLLDKMAAQRSAVMGGPQDDPRAKTRALLAGSTFDRAGAQALVDQKTGAMRSAAPELISAFGDFFDGLKPEQQQKVRVWMDKRGGRHGMFMGGSEHGGGMMEGHGPGRHRGMPPGAHGAHGDMPTPPPPPAAAAPAKP
jgi:Spy/CpxP family protein refolding chaperone